MTPYATLLHACALSHRAAARHLGVSQRTSEAWSSGRRIAPPDVIARLERLERSIDRIFGTGGPDREADYRRRYDGEGA